MFFYLLYNSNTITNDENKLIKLVIYSIVLYIVLHLIVNGILYRFSFLGYYFWIIFILDCLSLCSILARENNGEIVVNTINNISPRKDNPLDVTDEIERTTHNLEELLKETNDIKKMVKRPVQPVIDSKEFDRFIEELNNSDIEQKQKQNSINGFNSSSRNELQSPDPKSYKDEIDKLMGSLQNTDNREPPKDEINKLMGSLQNTDNREPHKDERERLMESLQNNINSKTNDDVTNIDSDIDIDISDFDKLIDN